jgi:hypothetical protein
MGTAVKGALGLDAVADDLAIAVLARRGERVDGAFEAIEIVGLSVDRYFERLVVVVSADFTFVHRISPWEL